MNLKLFLCGDVMTGRGIDQVLPFPSDPVIYEPYITDARDYINLAQRKNGIFKTPVPFHYIWGEALKQFELHKPDFRIINLETSVTESKDYWVGKGINYKMNPANITSLTCAGINCCVLANNHTIDWGHKGLLDTIYTLKNANIQYSGAGINIEEASRPAIMTKDNSRVLVFSLGTESSGIPLQWEADINRPGVKLLHGLSLEYAHTVGRWINMFRKPDDIVILSIHWGENWVFKIPQSHILFAHTLVDNGYVDVIHGHSSHHILGIEIYKEKPVLYGCGDFINDYEGIETQQFFRSDISMMFFITINTNSKELMDVTLVPLIKYQFSLKNPSEEEVKKMESILNQMEIKFKNRVRKDQKAAFSLQW